jgi:DNA-binding MarR family transcriptional regulator
VTSKRPGDARPNLAADTVRRRRQDRLRFLHRLYEIGDADVGAFQEGREIADALGIPIDEAERIVRYHEDRGYLRRSGGGLTIRITAEGVDYVESLFAEEE